MGNYRQIKIAILFSLLILAMSFWLISLKGDRLDRVTHRLGGKVKAGDLAPVFLLPNLDGNLVHLGSFKGKVIFLNLWATWCPPCVQEMPWMESVYRNLKGVDFEMLAVNIDKGGREIVRSFMEKYSLTLPVLLDPDQKVAALYGITGVPETFIINKRGIVDLKIIGPQNWTERKWRNYLEDLIGEKPEASLLGKNPA